MNLEITIRVPIPGTDAGAVTIETVDATGGGAGDGGADGSSSSGEADEGRRRAASATNGHGPEHHEPPSLEELGIAGESSADVEPAGPPDVATLLAPDAAPTADVGPPDLGQLGFTEPARPPAIGRDGSVPSADGTAVHGPPEPGPPSLADLEQGSESDGVHP